MENTFTNEIQPEFFPCGLGESITEHYKDAVSHAKLTNIPCYFTANDITFYANPDSDPSLAKNYLNDCYDFDLKECGPYAPKIDPVYKAKKKKENAERAAQMAAKWEAERKAELHDFEQVKAMTTGMKPSFVNKREYNKWKKNQSSSYGTVCFLYAEYLAMTLEKANTQGEKISKELVRKYEHMIRTYGITGFQHSCVVSILRGHWKYFKDEYFA